MPFLERHMPPQMRELGLGIDEWQRALELVPEVTSVQRVVKKGLVSQVARGRRSCRCRRRALVSMGTLCLHKRQLQEGPSGERLHKESRIPSHLL